MPIHYIQLTVSIHGLNADINSSLYLAAEVRQAVRETLLGSLKELYGFRDMFDSDIEVEVTEEAGV